MVEGILRLLKISFLEFLLIIFNHIEFDVKKLVQFHFWEKQFPNLICESHTGLLLQRFYERNRFYFRIKFHCKMVRELFIFWDSKLKLFDQLIMALGKLGILIDFKEFRLHRLYKFWLVFKLKKDIDELFILR